MRIFTYQKPLGASASRRVEANPLAPDVTWARFGNETLLFSDESPGGDGGASRGARIPSRHENVTKDQLHVVVQNGRMFQYHHPTVPVIHDRGRFLLVKLDPKRARKLAESHETCYGVMPLSNEQVVFDQPEVSARAPVAFVQSLVNKVAQSSFKSDLTKLVSFQTRNSTSTGFAEAATWARQQLKAMGYQTRLQSVAVENGSSRNIIADQAGKGSAATRKVVIVSAHLDSINLKGGPLSNAPGADDNGSGSAGLLEMARALKGHRGLDDLRFILFGGEEQGLFGSKRYVASLSAAERSRIKAVLNMDMIGSFNSDKRSVLLEGAPLSQALISNFSQAASTYTQLSVETSLNPFASDHVPFINAQIPAVLTIEGADNTNDNIHSAKDTLDRIDYQIAQEILRMNVAFVAAELGKPQ
jgi:Peptidase family M28